MELLKDSRDGFASYAVSRLRHEAFTLIDVGCSGGLDSAWRIFGDKLRAVGFDPSISEIERLTGRETFPDVRYEAAFVDLPPEHPVKIRRGEKPYWGRNSWKRLAVARTVELLSEQIAASSNEEKMAVNAWEATKLAEDRHVHLPDYFEAHGLKSIDFIKIDIDSGDFDVLQGLKEDLETRQVLGLGLEVNYAGSGDPTEHSFHNTDRFMKMNGFELFGLTVRTYSTSKLPMRYLYTIPAQNIGGRPIQGDALYIRDLCNPEWQTFASRIGVEKLIKLAALFAIGGLPDCAAELLISFRSKMSSMLDVDLALDMLTKESGPGRSEMGYRDLIEAFEKNSPIFYPPQ